MLIEEKLNAMGFKLPDAPMPGGSYIPVCVCGSLAFTCGQTACINGERRYLGKVGGAISLEDGKNSAREACLNCLSSLKKELGSLDAIKRIVKVVGYVNSASSFTEQHLVMNGASDLLQLLFGSNGYHVRSAVGTSELPVDSSVEIELIVEIVPNAWSGAVVSDVVQDLEGVK